VVHDVVIFTVKLSCKRALGNRETYGVSDTLTQRACGGFDARCIAEFRVPRRFRMQLAEVFQLFHWQIVTRQVQQAVLQH